MASYNKVNIMGNLTKTPELRSTNSGQSVVTLIVAVNRKSKNQAGEYIEHVDFIPVSVWGKQADNCNTYLQKGQGVFIEGRLAQKSWETPEGEKRSKLEFVADRVLFLSGGRKEDRSSAPSGEESFDYGE